jgi:hypothetical protein
MDISNNHSNIQDNKALKEKECIQEISKHDDDLNIKDVWSKQCNNILSYYYTTCIYLLNCEKYHDKTYIKKSSKNFVLKNKKNLIDQNKINNNNIYNVNSTNNCVNKNNNNFFVNKSINFNNNLMNKSNNNINYNINNFDLFIVNNKNMFNSKINYNEFQAKIIEESLIRNKQVGSTKDTNEYILEDCLIFKYGKRGWVCKFCNNFNYEMRVKCNRCGIIKNPKKMLKVNQKTERDSKKREDWICLKCSNLNYSFRTECNRCKLKLSENNQIHSQELNKEKLK